MSCRESRQTSGHSLEKKAALPPVKPFDWQLATAANSEQQCNAGCGSGPWGNLATCDGWKSAKAKHAPQCLAERVASLEIPPYTLHLHNLASVERFSQPCAKPLLGTEGSTPASKQAASYTASYTASILHRCSSSQR